MSGPLYDVLEVEVLFLNRMYCGALNVFLKILERGEVRGRDGNPIAMGPLVH